MNNRHRRIARLKEQESKNEIKKLKKLIAIIGAGFAAEFRNMCKAIQAFADAMRQAHD